MAFGGFGLGTATGTVLINTQQMRGAVSVARQSGNQIAQSMLFGLKAVDAQTRGWQNLGGAMKYVAATASVISGLGMKAAGYFQEQLIQLRAMTGSQREALALTEKMRTAAQRMGVPYTDIAEATRIILPTMEGVTDQLDRQWNILRRVAALNPSQGVSGAAFATNEALVSGGTDLKSIAERFNIPRNILREELRATNNDFWEALDRTLDRMGVTQKMAQELGTTFNAAFKSSRDAAIQLLAEGFTPIIEHLTPILHSATEFLHTMRETKKETLGLGAAWVTAASLGIPLVFTITKIVGLITAGLPAIAGFVGALAGLSVVNTFGRLTGNKQAENYGFKDVAIDFAKAVFIVQYWLGKLAVEFYRVIMKAVSDFALSLVSTMQIVTNFGLILAEIMPTQGMKDRVMGNVAGAANFTFDAMKIGTKAMSEADHADARFMDVERQLYAAGMGFVSVLNGLTTAAGGAEGDGTGRKKKTFDDVLTEKGEMITEFYDELTELDDRAAQQRLETEQQSGQQRAEAVREYGKQMVREEEDFARDRARALADHGEEISDFHHDVEQREADELEGHNQQMADIQERANERRADMEEDYQREREKALRDHGDKLGDLAGRLDARGIAEEQKRFRRQMEDMDEGHGKAVSKEEEQRVEQLAREDAQYNKRLERSRRDDAERLADMEADFTKRLAQEDEDRATRKARAAEDQAEQLAAIDTARSARLKQIDDQLQDDRTRLESEFRDKLYAENLYTEGWLLAQKDRQDKSIAFFKLFFKDIVDAAIEAANRKIIDPGGDPAGRQPLENPLVPTPFARGGYVSKTGVALVHRGETITPPQGRSGVHVNMHPGAITIHAAPNWSEERLGQVFDDHLHRFWEAAAGGVTR